MTSRENTRYVHALTTQMFIEEVEMAFDTLQVKAVKDLLQVLQIRSARPSSAIDQPAHHQHDLCGKEEIGERQNEQFKMSLTT